MNPVGIKQVCLATRRQKMAVKKAETKTSSKAAPKKAAPAKKAAPKKK